MGLSFLAVTEIYRREIKSGFPFTPNPFAISMPGVMRLHTWPFSKSKTEISGEEGNTGNKKKRKRVEKRMKKRE